MRDAVIPVLLPTPNEEVDKGDTQRMLSGLMRFYYLTRTGPPGEEAPEADVATEPAPPDSEPAAVHPTQLTARKVGKSPKKQ